MTPIGIFDSGYGGLTVLDSIRARLPHYDYIYLGDNARAPYGPRSFDIVYRFTLQAVRKLFSLGCPLVILACNTASAKALRTIQQRDLPRLAPHRRVLGVIRPTVEALPGITHNQHVGILATEGTIQSHSYPLEIAKLMPQATVSGVACPLWAALVEAGEHTGAGADYFVSKRIKQLLAADPLIDAILLACTHYPLLLPKIRQFTPPGITIVPQGSYVAESLADYLDRHTEMRERLTRGATCRYLTTEAADKFSLSATLFLRHPVPVQHIELTD